MPELPEVETICTALRPHLIGSAVTGLKLHSPALRHPLDGGRLRECCVGHTVRAVRRRGKYLIVELTPPRALLLHLGMSGSFRVEHAGMPLRTHDHVEWILDGGRAWRFNDVRRFGMLQPLALPSPGEDPAELVGLGPEPLDAAFTGAHLRTVAGRRTCPVKNLLMDQSVVAGVGNIYAAEALFVAGVHPARKAGRIGRQRWARLADAVRQVLRDAIICGGTTIRDFRGVDGTEGQFRGCLNVYGRAGQSCTRCGDAGRVRRIVMAGRSTFYCPRCQR